jgi:hypothetical protein
VTRHVEMEDPTPIVGKHHEDQQDPAGERGYHEKNTATVGSRWFLRKVRQL